MDDDKAQPVARRGGRATGPTGSPGPPNERAVITMSESRFTSGPANDACPEITHEKFRIWLRPDGVVEIAWAPHVPSGIEDARATIAAMAELTGGRAAPLLVHTTHAGPQDRAARMEFIRRQEVVAAVALIVGNPLSRMMATFFINVSKPEVPIRLFEDEAVALAWLKEHLV